MIRSSHAGALFHAVLWQKSLLSILRSWRKQQNHNHCDSRWWDSELLGPTAQIHAVPHQCTMNRKQRIVINVVRPIHCGRCLWQRRLTKLKQRDSIYPSCIALGNNGMLSKESDVRLLKVNADDTLPAAKATRLRLLRHLQTFHWISISWILMISWTTKVTNDSNEFGA